MKKILIVISIVGLVLTILPSMLVFAQVIEMKDNFTLMIVGTVLWFGSAPFWMKSKKMED